MLVLLAIVMVLSAETPPAQPKPHYHYFDAVLRLGAIYFVARQAIKDQQPVTVPKSD